MFNKVEICGVNTSRLVLLSEEEKTELLKKARGGDGAAREKLINGNLRLVLSVIQKFSGRGDTPDDLFQVGCIGLIKAVDNFDITLDVRFSTYAVPMIIGELRRYLRDNNIIRVSRSVRGLAYKALNEKENLTAILGREPTCEEITAVLNDKIKSGVYYIDRSGKPEPTGDGYTPRLCSVSEISDALDAVSDPISLFEPVYSDNGDSIYLMEQLSDSGSGMDGWTESVALSQAMESLSERERSILDMRFYAGKTQMEIASEIGISQAQVSRIEKGVLGKMKKQLS